jgi:hypothetical protein
MNTSMDSGTQKNATSDYLSLKDLIQTVSDYVKEFHKHRQLIYISVIVCLVYGLYNRWNSKKVYEAELSFMISMDQGNPSNLGLAFGQIGGLLNMGTDVNLQKILELAKSRKIAEKVFFSRCTVNDKEDILANHLIAEYESTADWAKKPFYLSKHPLEGFRFQTTDPQKFQLLENRALIELHKLLLHNLSTDVSEKTSIMKLSTQLTNETLSYEMARRLFTEMSDFYIDKMAEKQRVTYSDLRKKTDSLKALIERHQYKLAGIKDNVRATWLFQEDVPKTLLDQEIRMLHLVYAEALKNREVASFALETSTPFIQSIDLPIIPLKVIQQSWLKATILALCYGLLISCGFIGIRKFYRDQLT